MNKENSKYNYPNPERNKGTFIVKVDYCQRNTWQGRVIWAEENKILRFRSALELIRLMDEALSEGQDIQILAE
ncbi:hypothetical protein bpr_I2083 [Butyrivibrio proteoclasticus B316]|uniref:Uncharacterized protein n=1 Tax=Butyrivibrio proteoclasticus (strain ATCC 51982 / DSM 14932 / B316) TaxID=515622 RepID=E0RVG7_BUTPB|nr:hypothetical protein [Butyrivibrio proteoclasticus]ADL34816.1 hypothetical protein bpr_I2083 [Butyrivibrio proteoclasticus B316]